ncbi:MAG: prepilin-type N-terminal cleavage/methylation domain-containing protein [Sulfuricellaceae bacterium]|nr:prepilin-type N-terminal cleavage/methylation domain-containing protein [Sulfuricellaceae bacterium]
MKMCRFKPSGFTLIELALVLVVVALLMGGLLVPLSMQIEQQKTRETLKAMEEIKEALIGYSVANDRLPCPATVASNGAEAPVGGGVCTQTEGFVPVQTLGLSLPVDTQGLLLDSWGNRIRYRVTDSNTNAFTTTNGMKTATMSTLSPDLHVCASNVGITGVTCGTALSLVNTAPVLILSQGKNWASVPSIDEAANINGDIVFVSHTLSDAVGNEFDDLVTWLSPNILFNRMVAAGRLP